MKERFGGELIQRDIHGGDLEPDVVLQKDIVIPAGTVFHRAPRKTTRVGKGHYIAGVGLTNNTSGDLVYYVDPDEPEMKKWFKKIPERSRKKGKQAA